MGAHARLSPSSADRWMNCAGSVEAESREPDDDNYWSAEGTVAHKVLERCLKFGLEPYDFIGKVFVEGKHKVEVDDEMVESLQPIIDEIRDTAGEHYYETRVTLDYWLEDQFGTLDVGIGIPKLNLIVIRDLKYGKGLPVRAFENAQLRIYAAGIWKMKFEKLWLKLGIRERPRFRIIIDQPRNDGGGGTWEISYGELMSFMADVKRAGKATYDKNAPRTPGDKQCGYCKAAMNRHCKEYDEWNISKWGGKFQNYEKGVTKEPPDPDVMDPEMRALILDQAPALKQWLSRLHAAHVNSILAGRDGGGKKVVEGRKGRRVWRDEEAALDWMDKILPDHAELYQPRKVISPATAQKYLGKGGKKMLEPHVDQGQGKPVLVPEDDPRKAMESYRERFDEFDDED